ncbi:MAG: PIG-L family deacetylase, partial [Pseudomonadota bacterium]
VRLARTACPMGLTGEILHRLDAKEQQLGHALRLALGIEARAEVEGTFVTAGSTVAVRTELGCGTAETVDLAIECPEGWDMRGGQVAVPADAVHDPYPAVYDPMWPSAPRITLTIDGVRAALPFASPPVVLPASRAGLTPTVALLNRAKPGRRVTVAVDWIAPSSAQPDLVLPEGWQATRTEIGFDLTAPDAVPIGTHTIGLHLDGAAAATVRQISHPHIAPTATARPAETRVDVVDIAVPEARVGYIGAGNDRVDQWLGAMGAEVTDLSEAELTEAALAACQSLVIGIFAMRFRPGLAAAMPRIHRWVEAGGTLLTLYHRPWDGWDPDRIPPRRIEIGQPSLRWRVTDETADVRVIADHAVLRTPNPIGTADWDGWVKERGLYFAKSWDPAYTPLLAMGDPGETPLEGALLVGEIGAGRHIHTSLILHHQMDHLVPGAFRLIANLIAPRE